MVDVNAMNIAVFGVILVFLIVMLFTIKKNPPKKYWKIYVINIVILCYVLGSYINGEHNGINSIFVPIVYIFVIILNIQQLIRAIKNK